MKKTPLLLLLLTLPLSAAPIDKERSITVQGTGKVSAIPDLAVVTLEVAHDGPELDSILSQVRQDTNRVLEAIRAQGIEEKDIRTESFQVRPTYEQDKRGNPKPVGYAVTNRLSVKFRDLKKIGKVLSATLKSGATSTNGPDFELDNPQAIERQALAAATKDAKEKAKAVAEAAGVQLGEILSINPQGIHWPGPVRPLMMRTMAMSAAADTQEPISPGEQTLTGNVTLTYTIR